MLVIKENEIEILNNKMENGTGKKYNKENIIGIWKHFSIDNEKECQYSFKIGKEMIFNINRNEVIEKF